MDVRLLIAATEVLGGSGAHDLVGTVVTAGETKTRIRSGILNWATTRDAGTGTPIAELHGAARDNAVMAAIGGGPKALGGGGRAAGEKTLSQEGLKAQLVTYGVDAAIVVTQIGIRYAQLVRQDRKAAREAAATVAEVLDAE